MKWTKERKIYTGLLSVGLLALAADRLTAVGDPAEPPAESLVVRSTPSTPAVPVAISTLSERLAMWAQNSGTESGRDPFVPGEGWFGRSAGRSAGSPEPLRGALQLNGVLVAGGRSRAIIDGRSLGLGEVVDGYRLVSVSQTKAVLQSGSERVVLTLPD
jgi:hypothetical protein